MQLLRNRLGQASKRAVVAARGKRAAQFEAGAEHVAPLHVTHVVGQRVVEKRRQHGRARRIARDDECRAQRQLPIATTTPREQRILLQHYVAGGEGARGHQRAAERAASVAHLNDFDARRSLWWARGEPRRESRIERGRVSQLNARCFVRRPVLLLARHAAVRCALALRTRFGGLFYVLAASSA